jgi:hypothetical protein
VKADDAKIRPKIEEFGEIEVLELHPFEWRMFDLHVT